MKNVYYNELRLSDELERQLLEQEVQYQQDYAFEIAVKNLFKKVIAFFRAPEGSVQPETRTAH